MSDKTQKSNRKPSSFLVRTLSTIALLLVFVGVMWGGHIPSAIVVFIFQVRSRTRLHLGRDCHSYLRSQEIVANKDSR